jgi:hypothetical protein
VGTILIRRIKGFRPLYVNSDGVLWASNGFKVFRSNNHGENFNLLGRCDLGLRGKILAKSRLIQRVLRFGFHSLLPLSDGSLLGVIRKAIVRLDPNTNIFRKVFDIPRGTRPLNLCNTPSGWIYFGEYFSNPNRDPVHVYGSPDNGKTWKIVYTLSKDKIRHIHGIFYDPYRDGCWVLTGDRNLECRILFTPDNFRTLEAIAHGSQAVRVVTMIPKKKEILLFTDTPLEQNYIQRLIPKTGKLEKIKPLPGSVFSSAMAGNYSLISTVVEPSETNIERFAAIWFSKNGKDWKALYRQKKDVWPMKYFQYGTFLFPAGKNQNPVGFAYGQAVTKDDDCLLKWDLDECWAKL